MSPGTALVAVWAWEMTGAIPAIISSKVVTKARGRGNLHRDANERKVGWVIECMAV